MRTVVASFYPSDGANAGAARFEVDMFVLEIYCELWHKLEIEFICPPYTYTSFEDLVPGSEEELAAWDNAALVLKRTRDCDLLGPIVVWKQGLLRAPDAAAGRILQQYYFAVNTPVAKETTMAEECEHAFQKSVAGGFDSVAKSFGCQACGALLNNVRRSYEKSGHRDLSIAPPTLQRNFQVATAGRTVYPRPNNRGNPIIARIGKLARKKMGSDGRVEARGVAPRARKPLAKDALSTSPEDLRRTDLLGISRVRCDCAWLLSAHFVPCC